MQLPDAAPMAFWPPLLAVQGPGDASAPHAHHTLHLLLARTGTIRVRIAEESEREAGAVLTRADVLHAIDAAGLEVVILFVDPESDAGLRLAATLDGDARMFTPEERDALLAELAPSPGREELSRWMRATLDRLAGGAAPERTMHPRVRRLLTRLRDEPIDAELSLDTLAASAGLSPSRLMHVFTESVGIPIRPYLRWMKVQRATVAIVSGRSLSEAAIEAGFSDAAHMSRTFREMFGLAPSSLQRRSQSVQARS